MCLSTHTVLFFLLKNTLCSTTGSSLLLGLFSSCKEGLLSSCGASLAMEHGLSGVRASAAAAHRLSSCGSQALEHRLNSCGVWG